MCHRFRDSVERKGRKWQAEVHTRTASIHSSLSQLCCRERRDGIPHRFLRATHHTLCPTALRESRYIPQSHTTADRWWCRISPQRPGCGERLQRVRGEGAARRVYATAIARSLIDGLGLHLRLSQIPWLAGGRWALDALRGGIAVQRTAARAAQVARAPGGGSRVLARRGAPVKAAAHTAWIRNRSGLELG